MASTSLVASFAGQDRIFRLRIGEIGELETLCDAGIGGVFSRLATMQFKFADVRETIRLGLIGGGTVASQAAFFVKRYVDDRPLNENVPLAIDILRATFEGAKDATKADDPPSGDGSGKQAGSGDPATSPPSSQPASSQASGLTT